MTVWVFTTPALLLLLSVPLTIFVMRGAIALRLRHTGRRGPLRPAQPARRYQQFRALKPYRTLSALTPSQRVLTALGLALAVFLTVVAFWGGNVSHAAAATQPGNSWSEITPHAGNLTPETAHALSVVLLAVSGALAAAALWMILFGRVVNTYRADWYRAGLTDIERMEQKTIWKSPGNAASALERP